MTLLLHTMIFIVRAGMCIDIPADMSHDQFGGKMKEFLAHSLVNTAINLRVTLSRDIVMIRPSHNHEDCYCLC